MLIERVWRSVKHERVLLHEYTTIPELEALLRQWIERYNRWRPHTANNGKRLGKRIAVSRPSWSATSCGEGARATLAGFRPPRPPAS